MLKILFVCTGNTCRSPMAQAILNAQAKRLDLPLFAESAGLAAFTGDAPSANAVAVMHEIGIDIENHRSSRINGYMLDSSDLIVCMSRSHRAALLPYVPENKLLCVPGDISDPYGGDMETYRKCRDELSAYISTLTKQLGRVEIVPLDIAGVHDVGEIEKKCFSTPWSERSIAEALENDTAYFFAAKRYGETVGYIGTNIILDECYISNLAVVTDQRRGGIGDALLSKAEAEAQNHGCRFISLEVRKSNTAATALYQKHGFESCGIRKNYYSDPTEDGIIMTKYFSKD